MVAISLEHRPLVVLPRLSENDGSEHCYARPETKCIPSNFRENSEFAPIPTGKWLRVCRFRQPIGLGCRCTLHAIVLQAFRNLGYVQSH
jgi:hypothetical protein